VDDVLEFADLASLPATGEASIIYVTLDTNKTYRWSGSTYVEISSGPATTDGLAEGSTNLYFSDSLARIAAVVDSMAGTETDQAPSVSSVKAFIDAAGGVVVVDDKASLPEPGEVNKIYITKDEDKLWYYKDIISITGGDPVSTFEYTELSPAQPFDNEKFVLSPSDITNQYIDLTKHVKHNSLRAYANRLAIHQNDDYTLSVVSNKTRMSFVGDIATGGVSALAVGDIIYVNYTFPGA